MAPWDGISPVPLLWRVLGLNDFAAAQAGRADADPFSLSVDLGMHWTQVDVPAPLGHVVGVADAVSRLRLLAADFTLLCHGLLLPNDSDLVGQT
jgi:hypothetical protein